MRPLSDQTRGTLLVVAAVLVLSIQGLVIRWICVDRWTLIF